MRTFKTPAVAPFMGCHHFSGKFPLTYTFQSFKGSAGKGVSVAHSIVGDMFALNPMNYVHWLKKMGYLADIGTIRAISEKQDFLWLST